MPAPRPGSGDPARHYDSAANGMATHFAWLNRNKESLTLDFKTAALSAVARPAAVTLSR